jgi:hypothetical protein
MHCKCAICGYENSYTSDFNKWHAIPNFITEFYPVTKGGKPDGEVLNFICGHCLKSANSMRFYIKTVVAGVVVSKHAVERFISRTKADIEDENVARLAVLRAFSKSRKIIFKQSYTVIRIIKNRFIKADYYWVAGLIFVVAGDNPKTIVTVEKLSGKRLNKDYFYAD